MCQQYFTKEINMALVTLTTEYYNVLVHPSLEGLAKETEELIKKGWAPLGGPSATPSGKFMQGMVKEYKEPETLVKKGAKKK